MTRFDTNAFNAPVPDAVPFRAMPRTGPSLSVAALRLAVGGVIALSAAVLVMQAGRAALGPEAGGGGGVGGGAQERTPLSGLR